MANEKLFKILENDENILQESIIEHRPSEIITGNNYAIPHHLIFVTSGVALYFMRDHRFTVMGGVLGAVLHQYIPPEYHVLVSTGLSLGAGLHFLGTKWQQRNKKKPIYMFPTSSSSEEENNDSD